MDALKKGNDYVCASAHATLMARFSGVQIPLYSKTSQLQTVCDSK